MWKSTAKPANVLKIMFQMTFDSSDITSKEFEGTKISLVKNCIGDHRNPDGHHIPLKASI